MSERALIINQKSLIKYFNPSMHKFNIPITENSEIPTLFFDSFTHLKIKRDTSIDTLKSPLSTSDHLYDILDEITLYNFLSILKNPKTLTDLAKEPKLVFETFFKPPETPNIQIPFEIKL